MEKSGIKADAYKHYEINKTIFYFLSVSNIRRKIKNHLFTFNIVKLFLINWSGKSL